VANERFSRGTHSTAAGIGVSTDATLPICPTRMQR
jgi:hypothetical protein